MATKNLGFARAIVSSTTAPSNIKMIWYDSNPSQLQHKIYNTQTLQWEPLGGTGPELTVNDIPERDGLVGVNAGQKVFVKDATNGGGGLTAKDDPDNGEVEAGWALYRWDGVQYFIKIAEQESLDVTANTVGYTPTTPSDWEVPNPNTVREALDYLAARAVNYGRVFYVSANVAVDTVGQVGKFDKPFGPEALDGVVDTADDVVIFMPGIYNITVPINTAIVRATYYFMPGAKVTYNNAAVMIAGGNNDTSWPTILGKGEFTLTNSGALVGGRSSSLICRSIISTFTGSNPAISQHSFSGDKNAIFEVEYISVVDAIVPFYANNKIGRIDITGTGYIYANYSDGSNTNVESNATFRFDKIKHTGTAAQVFLIGPNINYGMVFGGEVETTGRLIGGSNQNEGQFMNIDIDRVYSSTSGYITDVLGNNTKININEIYTPNGGGFGGGELSTGLIYNAKKIVCAGYGIFSYGQETGNIYNVDYIESTTEHGIYIELDDSAVENGLIHTFNVKQIKALTALKHGIHIVCAVNYAQNGRMIVNNAYIKAPTPIYIDATLNVNFNELLLDGCKLISTDTYSIDADQLSTPGKQIVNLRNTIANKPANATYIEVGMDGLDVDSNLI